MQNQIRKSFFKKLLSTLLPGDKKKIIGLFVLMLLGAGLETFGLSMVVAYVEFISAGSIEASRFFLRYGSFFPKSDFKTIVWIAGFALVGIFVLKNTYSVLNFRIQQAFIAKKRIEIIGESLAKTYRQPYEYFLKRNVSEIVGGINYSSKVVDQVWMPLLWIATEVTVLTMLLGFMIFMRPYESIFSVVFFGGILISFFKIFRSRLAELSGLHAHYNIQVQKCLNQSIHGIKDVKFFGREKYFLDQFTGRYRSFNQIVQTVYGINQLPRFFVETLLVVAIVSIVIFSISFAGDQFQNLMSTLSLFAAGSLRIMPSINRFMNAAVELRQGTVFLDRWYDVQTVIAQQKKAAVGSVSSPTPLHFEHEIVLKSLSYTYPESLAPVIQSVSVDIPKRTTVAFIGPSGAGKSTLIDLMLGILSPTNGKILADGRDVHDDLVSWRKLIGYVPQSVYLIDDTIRRNVAFGVVDNAISDDAVWDALRRSQLEEFVRSLPAGLETVVGDRGVRMSGGQRQRLGIARALYLRPEILVFDEATSSLDSETEKALAAAIAELGREQTLIVIAHRLETIRNADKIFFVEKGQLVAQGTFDDLMRESSRFKEFVSVTSVVQGNL